MISYISTAVLGVPNTIERWTKSEVAHKWADWLRHPCRPGGHQRLIVGKQISSGHKWAVWLYHPYRLGSPRHFRAGDKIRSSLQVGGLAMSPLPCGGSPTRDSGNKIRSRAQVGGLATSPLPSKGSLMLKGGGQNQQWPTSGRIGYFTLAVGAGHQRFRGTKSAVAHNTTRILLPIGLRTRQHFSSQGQYSFSCSLDSVCPATITFMHCG